MSSGKRYVFNSKTLSYEVKKRSRKSRLFKSLTLFAVSLGMAVFYFWLYAYVLDLELPKTALLKKKNAQWCSRVEMLNRKLDESSDALTSLQMRDDYMKNIQINPTCAALGLNGAMMSAPQFFQAVGAQLGAMNPELAAAAGQYAALTSDHILDVEQTGTSISPVLALYFQKGKWAASAKYEFKMGTELEIKSAEVSAKDPVINGIFADGSKVKAETPALLAIAASRECGPVKITAEWHYYFDKDAENSFSSCITGNTQEYLVGAEWQISKKWLVSCGVQRTQLDMNENAYSDMNFSTSSWSTGIGVAYQVCDLLRINVGVMPTFYEEVTSVGQDSNGIDFTDLYDRTSTAWGIGLDFKF